MLVRTAAALLLTAALSGCGGQDCGALPELRAERDAAREQYAELVADPATTAERSGVADERVHALDARVYDAEQECAGRS